MANYYRVKKDDVISEIGELGMYGCFNFKADLYLIDLRKH